MHLLLLLLACTDGADKPADDSGAADTDADTDTDVDTDTDTLPVDEDNDGFDSTIDCDDNAYQIYPGAPEDCDGVDDDCDDYVDEDFDADGDGAFSVAECASGTDCDDTNDDIAPGATEVPYDAVDQDCDGADLTDVDGDGYDGGGGLDCDDTDATIAPLLPEVAKDGIDQDCDGVDSNDGDGDGHDDDALGGDDCDDADAAVFPGARDLWNDGVDLDCDGHDNTLMSLADAPVSISGSSTWSDLVGQDIALCDLDGDTLLDLVISAPFGESYAGQIGIFYGDGAATWGPGMLLTDADTVVRSGSMFLGFEVECADLDGDGYDDLVTGRGEIDYYPYPYDTEFELVIWYGDGAKLAATASEADSDASLGMELGVTVGLSNVYGRVMTLVDLDDDGASEIVVVNAVDTNLAAADDRFYVVGGGRYSGDLELVDETSAIVQGQGSSGVLALPDLDGDGLSELLLTESAYTVEGEAGDTGDTGDTGAADTYPGRASVVARNAVTTGALTDLAYGAWQGVGSEQFGNAAAVGDYDGDGLLDLAVGAFQDDTNADGAGALYVFAPTESAVPTSGSSADGAVVRGASELGYLGYRVETAGDIDGDGGDDLLVAEAYGDAYFGRVWLLSGTAAVGSAAIDDAALLAWTGETAYSTAGSAMAVGDLDGDGKPDFVIGAYQNAPDPDYLNGKVYVLLSGS